MASLNKVILIGNLTADPELKQTTNGISVTSFSIAIQRRFQKQSEGQSQTQQQTADFINIVAWRQTAEFICRFFKKGRPICITGSLQSRSWTDAQGNKRYTTEVVVDEASFVDSKPDANAAPTSPSGNQYVPDSYGAPSYTGGASPSKFEEAADDDNLPF